MSLCEIWILSFDSVKYMNIIILLWNIHLIIFLRKIYILSFHSVKYKSSPLTLKTIDLVILLCEIQFHSWKYEKYTSYYFTLWNIHLFIYPCLIWKIYILSFHSPKYTFNHFTVTKIYCQAQPKPQLSWAQWLYFQLIQPPTPTHPGKFISLQELT